MSDRIAIRMGGYGPPTTSFSRALRRIGETLADAFGDRVDCKYVWNVMDFGYKAEEIVWLAESGIVTLGYQSSSYLTDRMPELSIADLPFLFSSNDAARAAIDGAFGAWLAAAIERGSNFTVLGWFENGFRHISNRVRPIRTPADLAGLSIRMLPSAMHARTFARLGATPQQMDLTEAIARIAAGTVDAQENPLANTVTYGVHNFHRFHTLTGHFYISRPVFVNRAQYEAWPTDLQEAMRAAVADAVAFQRGETGKEHAASRRAIEDAGCEIVELSDAELAPFRDAVAVLHDEARATFGDAPFGLLGR